MTHFLRRTLLLALLLVTVSLIAAAQSSNGEVKSSARVRNEPPTNVRVDLSAADSDDATPGVQVSPVPNGLATVTVRAVARDGNGWQDLRTASFRVVGPDGTEYRAPADAAAEQKGSGTERGFDGSFTMRHYDLAGTYVVHFSVADRNDASAVGNASFTYLELLALSLGADAVSFGDGALGPGASTHGAPSAVGVRNEGNVALDLRLSGVALTTPQGDATIGLDRVKYSRDATMANEVALAESGIVDGAFDLAPGPDASRNAFFDIHVPSGEEQYVPADVYTGEITIGAVVG